MKQIGATVQPSGLKTIKVQEPLVADPQFILNQSDFKLYKFLPC